MCCVDPLKPLDKAQIRCGCAKVRLVSFDFATNGRYREGQKPQAQSHSAKKFGEKTIPTLGQLCRSIVNIMLNGDMLFS